MGQLGLGSVMFTEAESDETTFVFAGIHREATVAMHSRKIVCEIFSIFVWTDGFSRQALFYIHLILSVFSYLKHKHNKLLWNSKQILRIYIKQTGNIKFVQPYTFVLIHLIVLSGRSSFKTKMKVWILSKGGGGGQPQI